MQQAASLPRPVWMTVLGIIFLALGGVAALGGLVLAGGAALGGAALSGAVAGGLFAPLVVAGTRLSVVLAFFLLLFAAVHIAGGIGLLRGRRWARILALVLLWIAGISSLFGFLGGLGSGNFGSTLVNLVFVGLYALFIWKFYTDPVRAYFKRGLTAPPPTPMAPPAPGAPTAGPA
ncbi:MAG: hypothetical protein Q7T26_11765 [Dehalococcoidia bacterium]|nr:hypothetical protein [Dehalococcoidia bacterium]